MPGRTGSNDALLLIPENRSAFRALERLKGSLGDGGGRLLYLYGPSGVGKTCLIRQFLRSAKQSVPRLRSRQLTAVDFASQLAEASDAGTIHLFQDDLRGVELLVCEDVQFFQRKRESQRQFLACLDALLESGADVVLTAEALPGGLKQLDRRLADRCRGGLSVPVDVPGEKSRIRLVQHFAEQAHTAMPESAARTIARECHDSPRELEALVRRVIEQSRRRSVKLSPEFVEKWLEQELRKPVSTPAKIVRVTARHFQLKPSDLKSGSRRGDIVRARQCAMYLIRTLTGASHKDVAALFGKADHTSALRAIRKIENALENDPVLRAELVEIRRALRSP